MTEYSSISYWYLPESSVRFFTTHCLEYSENMYVIENAREVLPCVVLLEYDKTIKLVDTIEIYIDNNLKYIKRSNFMLFCLLSRLSDSSGEIKMSLEKSGHVKHDDFKSEVRDKYKCFDYIWFSWF